MTISTCILTPPDASKFAMYLASQKKLSGVPGGAMGGDPGVGGVCSPCGVPAASGGGSCASDALSVCRPGRLSLRIYSTDFPKNLASCSSRISSGVRFPFSHGDHCCGDTLNSSAHFLEPPRPGCFFILQSRIFHAIISRSSSGIFPIALTLPRTWLLSFVSRKRKRATGSRGAGLRQPMQTRLTAALKAGSTVNTLSAWFLHTQS